MSLKKKLVIIGGGMAGLCAAIAAAGRVPCQEGKKFESDIDMSLSNCSIGADAPAAAFGKTACADFASAGHKLELPEILVLDAGKEPGRKILATGNGRCNLTNRVQEADCYRCGNGREALPFYESGWDREMTDFMASLGVLTHERNGYVYPRTDQAATVLQALLRRAEQSGIRILRRYRAGAVRKKRDGTFSITGEGPEAAFSISAAAVILACGGMVSGTYHCMGDGYRIAKSLGHSVKEPVPALCALYTDDPYRKLASGVRTAARVQLFLDGEKAAEDIGEIQMTADGISGIPVFQVSRYAARARKDTPEKEITTVLDFLPELSERSWEQEKERRLRQMSDRDTLGDLCLGLVPDKIAAYLIAGLGEAREKKIGNLKDAGILEKLLDSMRSKKVRITKTADFEKAQVTAGGVLLCEVSDAMESRFAQGLFFAGEILDVDGVCGGYNLTWAMHSGFLAGKAACAMLQKKAPAAPSRFCFSEV